MHLKLEDLKGIPVKEGWFPGYFEFLPSLRMDCLASSRLVSLPHLSLSEFCRASAKLLGQTEFFCRDVRLLNGGFVSVISREFALFSLLFATLGLSYLSGTF